MLAYQATCVAIGNRALLIEGPSGSGKSSLALELIDRGGALIGDDSVMLEERGGRLMARPHAETRCLIEVRNLGLITLPVCDEAPVALVLKLAASAPRYVEAAATVEIAGIRLPRLRLWPRTSVLALKAELALDKFGLSHG
jgi:serine kinase of HPr protein (carbohydrate metabolism regulator)